MDLAFYEKMANEWANEEKDRDKQENDYLLEGKFLQITHDDMVNGEGLRTVLWLSGCEHKCPHCHNPHTWDGNEGLPFTKDYESEFFESLKKDTTDGCTFTGGDPLFHSNRAFVKNMVLTIKKLYPEKSIWIYTGYTVTEVKSKGCIVLSNKKGQTMELDWLQYIDVLVDGPFDYELRQKDLENGYDPDYVGSSNQRLIDIPKSVEKKEIIRWEEM